MHGMRNLALLPNGLRAKFVAAFACMSILPFLVCLYLVTTFVFPYVDSIWLTSSIILITMLISFCGFNIMEEIVSSIIALSRDARRLAAHSRARLEPPAARDEVAAIKESLSMLAEDVERKTLKMKQLETMDEKIGIFTERDALFRVLAAARDPATTTVGEVMTPQPQTMHPDEPFVRALRVMFENRFRHLPVVEFGRPLGIVSVRDALDEDLVEHSRRGVEVRVRLHERIGTHG